MSSAPSRGKRSMSPSSRRAWIEIFLLTLSFSMRSVALLAEGVDRNRLDADKAVLVLLVALLAEGVDRNLGRANKRRACRASPSSRRAWIEI